MDAIAAKISDLQRMKPERTARPDYEEFWRATLELSANKPLNGSRLEIATPLSDAKVHKVVYEGHDGTPIHGWFLLPPRSSEKPFPCIVQFHGYTGSKGEPEDNAAWLMMGFAVLAVDVRGQGGETGNRMNHEFGMAKGWITQGILDKDTCYYKAITLDGLRAIDWAAEQPEVDRERIIVLGTSQGGGLTLMMAAFHPNVRMALANIPNMCQMDHGILNSTGSLTEAAEFVNRFPDKLDAVLTTLSYFDVVNAADRIQAPVYVTVGLKDTICLPETVYAAYNRIASPDKTIAAYPFMGHYVPPGHLRKEYEFIIRHLGGTLRNC